MCMHACRHLSNATISTVRASNFFLSILYLFLVMDRLKYVRTSAKFHYSRQVNLHQPITTELPARFWDVLITREPASCVTPCQVVCIPVGCVANKNGKCHRKIKTNHWIDTLCMKSCAPNALPCSRQKTDASIQSASPMENPLPSISVASVTCMMTDHGPSFTAPIVTRVAWGWDWGLILDTACDAMLASH
jgi:hypothetical protein